MKRCSACGETKDITDFSRDSSKAGGLSNRCRLCDASKRKASRLNTDSAARKLVIALRRNGSCLVCGESEDVCLHFHHRHPEQKMHNIAKLVRKSRWGESMKVLEEELRKCVIVCANCHLKIHAGLVSLPGE